MIAYTYDADGDLLTAKDDFSSYTYTYNSLGEQTSVDNNGSGPGGTTGTPGVPDVVLSSSYDADGNRTQLSATIGGTADFVNTYSYDGLNRETQVTQGASTASGARRRGQQAGELHLQRRRPIGVDRPLQRPHRLVRRPGCHERLQLRRSRPLDGADADRRQRLDDLRRLHVDLRRRQRGDELSRTRRISAGPAVMPTRTWPATATTTTGS